MHDDCVTDYLDELLLPTARESAPEPLAESQPPEPSYSLVHIGGLRLLLPPAHAKALRDTPDTGESLTPIDVRPILFPPGHPARNRPAEPHCWLPMPSKAMQLWFETDAGPVELNPDMVSWRQDNETRPWLRGTVAALKAAIIDPEALAAAASASPSPSGATHG